MRWTRLLGQNQGLRESVEAQCSQLEALGRRVAVLESRVQRPGDNEAVNAGDDQRHPHRPRPRMPGAGVVTLEEHPDEEHDFGPAAALVKEWMELRTMRETTSSRRPIPWMMQEWKPMFAGGGKPWWRPVERWRRRSGQGGCGLQSASVYGRSRPLGHRE